MTTCELSIFTSEYLRQIDVHELLPQQEPFVMIGCLSHLDMVRTITETMIQEDNLFVENRLFSESGLIENIAQTCAARIGFVNKYIYKKPVQMGFIGSIRNMEVLALPRVGEVITTTVDVREEVFGMTLAEATVFSGEKLLATTEIKIAIKDRS